jgi:hypothetical protein
MKFGMIPTFSSSYRQEYKFLYEQCMIGFRGGIFVAENLVIPEFVTRNQFLYQIREISDVGYEDVPSTMIGTLNIPNSVIEIDDDALIGSLLENVIYY